MGCYQEGIAKDSIAGKDVTAHIFEYASFTNITKTFIHYIRQVYFQRRRHRQRRSITRDLSSPDFILLERAEQKEIKQS